MINKLIPIFKNVFNDDDLTINSSTTAQDVVGWDSLTHVRLIVTIEKNFSIRFTAADISGIENVGQLIEIISRKLK